MFIYRPSLSFWSDFLRPVSKPVDDLKGSQVKGGSGRDCCMAYVSASHSHSLVPKWPCLIVPVSPLHLALFTGEGFNKKRIQFDWSKVQRHNESQGVCCRGARDSQSGSTSGSNRWVSRTDCIYVCAHGAGNVTLSPHTGQLILSANRCVFLSFNRVLRHCLMKLKIYIGSAGLHGRNRNLIYCLHCCRPSTEMRELQIERRARIVQGSFHYEFDRDWIGERSGRCTLCVRLVREDHREARFEQWWGSIDAQWRTSRYSISLNYTFL